MILANRNGLMIATKLLTETATHWILQHSDCKRPSKVSKTDARKRLFDNTDQAMEWIDGVQP